MHVCELKPQRTEVNGSTGTLVKSSDEGRFSDIPLGHDVKDEDGGKSTTFEDEMMDDQGMDTTTVEEKTVGSEHFQRNSRDLSEQLRPGAVWDVFRRQDIPKLIEYLKKHQENFGQLDFFENDVVSLIA